MKGDNSMHEQEAKQEGKRRPSLAQSITPLLAMALFLGVGYGVLRLAAEVLLIAAAAVAGLIALGFMADLGFVYAAGVVLVVVLLAIENSLVRPGNYKRVNLAFFTINGAVSVALGALTVLDVLLTLPTAVT